MNRLSITVIPEANKSFVLLSCLSSEKTVFEVFFEQVSSSTLDKTLFYFDMILPLFSENLVLNEKLWTRYDEKTQAALTYMTNTKGKDHFALSQGIGMGLRNAAKEKEHDYSKRSVFDLFQKI